MYNIMHGVPLALDVIMAMSVDSATKDVVVCVLAMDWVWLVWFLVDHEYAAACSPDAHGLLRGDVDWRFKRLLLCHVAHASFLGFAEKDRAMIIVHERDRQVSDLL